MHHVVCRLASLQAMCRVRQCLFEKRMEGEREDSSLRSWRSDRHTFEVVRGASDPWHAARVGQVPLDPSPRATAQQQLDNLYRHYF